MWQFESCLGSTIKTYTSQVESRGDSVAAVNLPAYSSKGNRRTLDRWWLESLHREGRSRFLASVPEPPAELALAIAEFNRGQYWQCHETLERLWLPEQYPLRLFYHGLIKVAVGLLHLERHNPPRGHGQAARRGIHPDSFSAPVYGRGNSAAAPRRRPAVDLPPG